MVSLGEIAEFRNGVNFVASDRGVGVPILNVKDFQDRTTPDYNGLDELKTDAVRKDALVRVGDTLFVRSNGNKELIGRSMHIRAAPPRPTTHSAFTIRMRVTSSSACPMYCAYYVRGSLVRRTLAAQGSGTNISNLNQDILARLPIWLPPLDIQHCIASILSAYDDLIDVNTRRITILEEMAHRLFYEWFVRFNYPGRNNADYTGSNKQSVPTGWGGHTIGHVLSLSYGKALKADGRIEGPVPVYGSSGVVGWHDTALVTGPGIIVGRKGNVGAVHWSATAFYPIDTVFYVVTDWPLNFVFNLLRNQTFLNSDSAVPGLNRDQALRKKVALPPKELADRFDRLVCPNMELATKLQSANRGLKATRDLLLPKLISGEIDVSQAEAKLEAAQ